MSRDNAWFAAFLIVAVAGVWLFGVVLFVSDASADPVSYDVGAAAQCSTADVAAVPTIPPEADEFGSGAAMLGYMRGGQLEQRASCLVLVDRLDQIGLLIQNRLDLDGTQQLVIGDRLAAIADSLGAPVEVTAAAGGLPVREQDPQAGGGDTADVVASVDGGLLAVKGALWTIAGLIVGLFGGYALYRQVMPRA